MPKKYKLTVVILNHNSVGETKECIDAILKSDIKFEYEVIVVDNSEKKTFKIYLKGKYSSIKYIESKNKGYGAGNNLGVKYAKGEYIFILNPDCRIQPNTIQVLTDFLDKNIKAGAVAPNLVDRNGKVFTQMGSRELTPLRGMVALSFINKIFPNNRISRDYYLYDISHDEIRVVDAIPGSAFMIRKNLFLKIGGFDEKIFLYFEESDIGKQIKRLGYELYITPNTQVFHKWNNLTKSEKLKYFFDKSRFYYFKKYYGILNALLVELFCRISKYNVTLFIIFLLGIFLRFYKAKGLFVLDSETADNLLDIKNYYFSSQIPLLGPPTSHPWLYFGPLFYWLYGPILVMFHFNPLTHIYFGLIVNSLVIIVNYLVVQKYWNKYTALLSSFFISVSPYLLGFSFLSRFYTYTVIISLITLMLLEKFLQKRLDIFWLFISIGILLNFHYSALVLIPGIIIIVYLNKFKFKIIDYIKILLGLFIPLSPIFLYDIQNRLAMTKNIILWFPYRILSVLNIIPNKNLPKGSLLKGFNNTISFVGYLFSDPHLRILYIAGLLLIIILIYIFIKNYLIIDKKTKELFLLIAVSIFLLTLHGDTPNHYFLVVSSYFLIFISIMIVNYLPKILNTMVIFIFLIIAITNIIFFVRYKYITAENRNDTKISYFNLKNVAKYIYDDSKEKPIAITRIGDYENYEGNFAQNYQYLLWKDGNEPVKVGNMIIKNINPEYKYTIIEIPYDYGNLSYISKTVIGGITILKSNYEQ